MNFIVCHIFYIDPDWNNKTVAIPKRSNRKRGSSNTIIEELLEPLRKKQRKPHMCRRCREELHIEVLLKNHRCPFKNGTHFLKGTDFGGTDDFNSMTEIDDRLLIDQVKSTFFKKEVHLI